MHPYFQAELTRVAQVVTEAGGATPSPGSPTAFPGNPGHLRLFPLPFRGWADPAPAHRLLAILYLVVHALFGRFEERAGQGRKLRLEVQFPSPAPHNDKTRAWRGFFVDVAMEGWWSVHLIL